MYHGGMDGVRSNAGTPRQSYDAQQRASRSATPRSDRHSPYPIYTNSPPSGAGGGGGTEYDYEYEERDLGMAPYQAARPASAQFAGPSSVYGPNPPRSSYSSPPPGPNRGYSWEVHSQYSHPTSAPPDYPPYQQDRLHGQEAFPGSYPDYRSEPTQQQANNDFYWYAGAPPSSPSSHAFGQPSTPMGNEPSSGFFGVSAPHHHPGHRHSGRREEALPNFPQWSRTWYDGHLSANGHAYTTVPPQSGQSGWESETLTRNGGSGPYGHVYGHRGMTDFVKEERMRMLEREFGKPKVSHNGGHEDGEGEEEEGEGEIDDEEELPLGSVTSSGKLVTERPKWNLAIRCLLGITALAGCACGLGGALLIKTSSSSKPAPQGTIPAYILYACSVITLLVLLYLYVFRACCCDPMRKEAKAGAGGGAGNALGGMVIPILSGGGPGGKMKKNKRFGKGGMMQQQAPTVNLIVDPTLLGAMGGGRGNKGDDWEEEDDERLPGDARRSKKRKNGLGVLGNMQMQRRWQLARSKVKLLTTWDVILCILWIACDVVSLGLGKKCPSGSDGGWCDFYNAAVACGVILVVILLAAIYLDYRDLKVSRQAPKPPM